MERWRRNVGVWLATAVLVSGTAFGALAAAPVDTTKGVGDLERACEATIAAGPRADAVAACEAALTSRSAPLEERDMVAALMSGSGLPVAEDLAHALALARDAKTRAPEQPWGYDALCDIAERIGDEVMLQNCSDKLRQVAPGEDATRKALAAAAAFRLTWWQSVAWVMIASAALLTALHALWSRVRRMRLPKDAPAALVAALLLVALPGRARADAPPEARGDLSAWKIDDADPEKSIPSEKEQNRDPVQFGYWLQDLTARAAGASKRGDHAASIKYYRAMAKAVPDRSVAFAKLCDEYEAMNDRESAVAACGLGLFREGVTNKDYVHYANLVLTLPGRLNDVQVNALNTIVKHLREDPNEAALADELECESGVRTNNAAELEECTTGMAARAPNEPKTLVYEWNLAMQHSDYDAAMQILARAKTVPQMKPEAIANMESETAATQKDRRSLGWLIGGGFVVFGAVTALVAKLWFGRRRSELRPA